jgi:hypothetical protein
MDRAVVLLKNIIIIWVRDCHRRNHNIFKNPNINVIIERFFYMKHYPRTTYRNPWPAINRKPSTVVRIMNVSFTKSGVLGLYTLIRPLREDWNTFSSEKTTLDQKASSFNKYSSAKLILASLCCWVNPGLFAATWLRSPLVFMRRCAVFRHPGKPVKFLT